MDNNGTTNTSQDQKQLYLKIDERYMLGLWCHEMNTTIQITR